MKIATIKVGFVPLVDAAPLIVAQEMGFANEEGISLDLKRVQSWSELRDRLWFGQIDAAHMLSPIPVAAALGLGGGGSLISAVSVLSVNGNVIGVSRALANRLKDVGHDFAFNDARSAGEALIAAKGEELRIGVPFPFSMHAELVFYWLSALGFHAPQNVDIRTVPPPLMANALSGGEIDAFCVGEPWGSKVVETGLGELLLPGNAIWSFAPEKVLAVSNDWAATQSDLCARLIRAVWRAGRWLAKPTSRTLTAELLSRPDYLDLAPDIIDRALFGNLVISPAGDSRTVPGFVEFHRGAATFPWRSQAEWIGLRLAARTGLDRADAARLARTVFLSDIHRSALAETVADLPSASAKIEGAVEQDTEVASAAGTLMLRPDAFFDGRVFEPIEE